MDRRSFLGALAGFGAFLVGKPGPQPKPAKKSLMPRPTIVGACSTASAFNTSLSVPLPAGVVAGDLLVLFPSAFSTGFGSVSPAWGLFPVTSGWTFAAYVDSTTITGIHTEVWYKTATAGDISTGSASFAIGSNSNGTYYTVGAMWALRNWGSVAGTYVTFWDGGTAQQITGTGSFAANFSGSASPHTWLSTGAIVNPSNDVAWAYDDRTNWTTDGSSGGSVDLIPGPHYAHWLFTSGQVTTGAPNGSQGWDVTSSFPGTDSYAANIGIQVTGTPSSRSRAWVGVFG